MDLIKGVTDVFGAIGEWIISFLQSLIPLFWVEGTGVGETATAGHLTFFGIMAVIGLAISVFFLLMRVIENFIHLRS